MGRLILLIFLLAVCRFLPLQPILDLNIQVLSLMDTRVAIFRWRIMLTAGLETLQLLGDIEAPCVLKIVAIVS